jgi:hypothetical protein
MQLVTETNKTGKFWSIFSKFVIWDFVYLIAGTHLLL